MKTHFIAIGGSAMHNLAIALHQKGHTVTGSDDEIFDPARTRLAKHGLLPQEIGWNPDNITPDIDEIVLGMHARKDNPELLRAQELGLRIYSYPEYLYEQSKAKIRVVIGGSHGKTTTTAMILHVLKHAGIEADYMVGAQLEGFDCMVRLSETARVMVIEGDEYLTSPIDPRPKFHLYHPHIAVLTGIEWDHVNVFPSFEIYKDQFRQFIALVEPGGSLFYCQEDEELVGVAHECQRTDIQLTAYGAYHHEGLRTLYFGHHNMLNTQAAFHVCRTLGVTEAQFLQAIATFKGASKRLELVKQTTESAVYKDFAHAPSKVRATVRAMKEHFPSRRLVACLELHTFSSLTADFLHNYQGTMDMADEAIVYFNPHAVAHKKLPPLSIEQVQSAFGSPRIRVYNDSAALVADLRNKPWSQANLLLMSSGNFDGIDFNNLANELI